jgi:hypothetical protein
MKNSARVAVATAVAGGLVAIGTVGIAPAQAAPKNAGAACVQEGIGFLKERNLLKAAAQKKIDYSTLADPVAGPIFTTLPEGSFLSLGQVVKLHTSNPELFAWC